MIKYINNIINKVLDYEKFIIKIKNKIINLII